MKIQLNHPYKVNEKDRAALPTDADVTVFLITTYINMKFRDRMPRSDSRLWSRIMPKLDNLDANGCADLEKSEFLWLKDRIQEWEPPASFTQWYWLFWDYLEGWKDGSAN